MDDYDESEEPGRPIRASADSAAPRPARVAALLNEVSAAPLRCPVCGGDEWALIAAEEHDTASPALPVIRAIDGSIARRFAMDFLACDKCGYTMLFSRRVIDQRLKEAAGKPDDEQ